LDPTVLWMISIALIVLGLVGTVLPGLPGVVAIFGGMLLAAWIDGFERIGIVTLVVLGVLTAIAFVIDIFASLLGARRVGASKLALVGAFIGAIAGLFFGFFGLLIGPFVGAFIGEYITRQQLDHATRVGLGTWLGLLIGVIAKLALAFTMVGVFVAAYFIP
jgi:uncharacterized protein YqgC (DUF456 family)